MARHTVPVLILLLLLGGGTPLWADDEPAPKDEPAKNEPAKDEPAKDEPAKNEPAKDESSPQEGEETPPAYAPRVLPASLKDRADKALAEKRRLDAIELYTQWLAADPRDASSWYNLACAYALEGQADRALDAFETSVDAGLEDLQHPTGDPDLASVREHARFQAALARGIKAKSKDGLPGLRRHTLTTETIGTYVVLLPPDYEASNKSYPVVFLLHGSGSSEIGHARVAADMGREDVIYVAPRALHPHPWVFKNTGKPGWTAWPPEGRGEGKEATDPMRLYADWVVRCASHMATRYRVRGRRFFVWGHSQGAAAANVVAAVHPSRVAGYFSYAGYYPEHMTAKALGDMRLHKISVELCHGTNDAVVPSAPTTAMGARLKQAGVEHKVHLVDAGHRITDDVKRLSRAWADARVRTWAAPKPVATVGKPVVQIHVIADVVAALVKGRLGFEVKDGKVQAVAKGSPVTEAEAGALVRDHALRASGAAAWPDAARAKVVTQGNVTLVVRASKPFHEALNSWVEDLRLILKRRP